MIHSTIKLESGYVCAVSYAFSKQNLRIFAITNHTCYGGVTGREKKTAIVIGNMISSYSNITVNLYLVTINILIGVGQRSH
jgi:hypothetical protein